jgi:glycerol-3-phosphate dehydrogenase
VLRALNASVTTGVTRSDILGTWAGLRPLVKDATSERTADLSRRHAVRRSTSGVITITGGKLTTYRRMAADTVDEVAEALDIHRRSSTKHVVLLGGEGFDPDRPREGLDAHLASRYGTEAEAVALLAANEPDLARPLVPGLPYVRAEAMHAVRHEMARTLDDILSRRTRARLLGRDDAARVAEDVGALVAPELGWSEADLEHEVGAFRDAVAFERASAALPETALDATIGA